MKILKTSIIALSLLFTSIGAMADWVDVNEYHLWSNTYETPTIRLSPVNSGSVHNPNNCTDADSYMVKADLDEKSKDRIYSTLLAASMAKRPIRLWVSGCERARPAILNVVLPN